MKKILGAVFMLTSLGLGYWYSKKNTAQSPQSRPISDDETQKRLRSKVLEIEKFIEKNTKYNNDIVFLSDLKIESGKNRFFVYDLKEGKLTDQGLMAHGSGSETGVNGALKFSNIPNSNTTSLGKYAIGHHYIGKFGKAYKLFGLDKTNDKAFERFIVLHHFNKVPEEEQTSPICNSLGCPMVNEKFFNRLEKIIDGANKPILLYLYY
ncbi:MAG: murein L,D-transpeptidase catalytic domain-containing protein [Flavobacterium sp.]|uniref:murein L,D-transpeptidase catalytic domain-containing protein n=1 Tax=Flavobacterium TaxID=237 RepID=UPI00391D3E5E